MKKYFGGVMAIILAISFSAFTINSNNDHLHSAQKWFIFNGTSPGDLNNASKYSMDGNGSSPTVCLYTAPPYRCEIFAIPQSGNPSLPDLTTISGETKRVNP